MFDPIVQSVTLQGLNLVIRVTNAAVEGIRKQANNAKIQNSGAKNAQEVVNMPETQEFNIRSIANTELRHDLNNFNTVHAYVGIEDQNQRPLFARKAIKKKYLGIIDGADKLNNIRETFQKIAPLIEY